MKAKGRSVVYLSCFFVAKAKLFKTVYEGKALKKADQMGVCRPSYFPKNDDMKDEKLAAVIVAPS